MKKVAVLGVGRVGSLIARDLARESGCQVAGVDRDDTLLARLEGSGVEPRRADLGTPRGVREGVGDADLVVVAVPGAIGFSVLRSAIGLGRPIVDISFAPEDPLALDDAAKAAAIPVVVDAGVAPGLSNLLAAHAVARLDEARAVEILVGGLPERRVWPYEYRSVFSPTDVIEEYLRPARMRVDGREVTRPALSEPELVEFEEIGTLEAFNTDGLRTLLTTLEVPTLLEKTLRYPGHAERMRMLRESGFFGGSPVETGHGPVVPRALTERLLFDAWELPAGERELTLLRVTARGTRNGAEASDCWELIDRTDPVSGTTSMARTTGFPCAILARWLMSRPVEPGIHPPERFGRDTALVEHMLAELRSRGVHVRRRDA